MNKTPNKHQAGKGDKPRPVNYRRYSDNYDSIFRKKSHVTAITPVPLSTAVKNLEKATKEFLEKNPELVDWMLGAVPKVIEDTQSGVTIPKENL